MAQKGLSRHREEGEGCSVRMPRSQGLRGKGGSPAHVFRADENKRCPWEGSLQLESVSARRQRPRLCPPGHRSPSITGSWLSCCPHRTQHSSPVPIDPRRKTCPRSASPPLLVLCCCGKCHGQEQVEEDRVHHIPQCIFRGSQGRILGAG